jgi:AcrR family transcriptional regulator
MPRPKINPAYSPKRQAILEAALDLFSERGFHGTIMPAIAELAGVGTGTLYRYFVTKETLVNELFRQWKTAFATHVMSSDVVVDDPRLAFRSIWRAMWTFYRKHPKAVRFLELHHHGAYLDAESRLTEERILQPLNAFIESAQRKGDIRRASPAIMIALVHGAFLGLIHAEVFGHISVSTEAVTEAETAIWAMLGGR